MLSNTGNIEFDSVQVEGVEGCKVSSRCSSSLKLCCDLLGVDARQLSHCLTFRELQTMAPGKTSVVFLPCLIAVLYTITVLWLCGGLRTSHK